MGYTKTVPEGKFIALNALISNQEKKINELTIQLRKPYKEQQNWPKRYKQNELFFR